MRGTPNLLHQWASGHGRAADRGLQADHRRRARPRRQPARAGGSRATSSTRRCWPGRRRPWPRRGLRRQPARPFTASPSRTRPRAAAASRRSPSSSSATFSVRTAARVHPTLQPLLKDYGQRRGAGAYRHNPLPFHQQRHAGRAGRRGRPRSRGNSGRCTTSCSRTQPNSIGLRWTDTRRSLGWTWRDSKRRSTPSERGQGSHQARHGRRRARLPPAEPPTSSSMGASLSGAQPIEAFKQPIDEEIKQGERDAGRRDAPRRALRGADQGRPRQEGRAEAAKPDPDADLRIRVDVAGAPVRGPADAPITIVEWSDFQCPFCVRAEADADAVGQEYPEKIARSSGATCRCRFMTRPGRRPSRPAPPGRRGSSGRCTIGSSPTRSRRWGGSGSRRRPPSWASTANASGPRSTPQKGKSAHRRRRAGGDQGGAPAARPRSSSTASCCRARSRTRRSRRGSTRS